MENWSFYTMSAEYALNVSRAHTKCIVKRDDPLAFKAMKRNGLGAAWTAVLEKLRFPRISCKHISGDFTCVDATNLKCLDLHLRTCFVQILRDHNVCDSPAV
jgi:hypothetical protein